MSVSTVVNALPKSLRNELKAQFMKSVFTDEETRATFKPQFESLVPSYVEKLVRSRQELLMTAVVDQLPLEHRVLLLTEIECLRLTLSKIAELK